MEQVLIRLQMIINRYVKVKEGRSTAGNGGAFFITWVPVLSTGMTKRCGMTKGLDCFFLLCHSGA